MAAVAEFRGMDMDYKGIGGGEPACWQEEYEKKQEARNDLLKMQQRFEKVLGQAFFIYQKKSWRDQLAQVIREHVK